MSQYKFSNQISHCKFFLKKQAKIKEKHILMKLMPKKKSVLRIFLHYVRTYQKRNIRSRFKKRKDTNIKDKMQKN